jgi:hypothetical protein
MKTKSRRLASVLAGASLYVFASAAFAQDDASAGTSTTPATKPDAAAATKEMPKWEAFGAGDTPSLEENFFRLARDFVTTSELGVRRLGHVPVWPRGELKLGSVRILPYVREGVEYESNFYRQPETGPRQGTQGRDAQWTLTSEAGALADTMLAGGRLRISASADSIWSTRFDDEKPDTWEADVQIGGTYHFPSSFWIACGFAWERRNDPADIFETGRDFDRSNRRGFVNWGFDKDIFFGSKVRIEMGVSTRNSRSQDKVLSDLNRTETTYFVKASYPFLRETTRIFVMGTYGVDSRDSDRINSGQRGGVNVGLEGSIPLREGEYRGLRGQVSVGFTSALYDNETFNSGSSTIIADENRRNTNLNVQVGLQYLMSPKSTIDLRYVRQNQFTFHGNYQITDRVDLTYSHNITRNITGRLAVYGEHSNPSGQIAQETQPHTHPDNTAPAPNVNNLGAGIGLRWAFNEWMDFDWSFDYSRRNDHEKSYSNYRSLLGVTVFLNSLTPRPRTASPR